MAARVAGGLYDFFCGRGVWRGCGCYTGAMWAKYNRDEVRAGARNFGVGIAVIGFINLMFRLDPVAALLAIGFGVWVFFKASEKGDAS